MATSDPPPSDGRLEFEVAVRDGEAVSAAVVRALSLVTARDPLELPPLADAVDPAALDRLCESAPFWYHVQFTHDGYEIHVRADGTVRIHAAPSSDADA